MRKGLSDRWDSELATRVGWRSKASRFQHTDGEVQKIDADEIDR